VNMKHWVKKLALRTLVCLLVGNIFTPFPALAAGKQVTVMFNGRSVRQEVAPVWEKGRVLVSLASLKEALGLSLSWDSAAKTVTAARGSNTLQLVPGSRNIWHNDKEITLDVAPKLLKGRTLVPVKLFEFLEVDVTWDGETDTVSLSSSNQIAVPKRVSPEGFPAKVAFTSNGQLWLLDGEKQEAKPVQVTKSGTVEIIGWSQDGKWLAYLSAEQENLSSEATALWVVDAQNLTNYQVDAQVSFNNLSWSPADNSLVYTIPGPADWNYNVDVKMARTEKQQAVLSTLLKSAPVSDVIWTSAGDELIIAMARSEESPLSLERLSLKGERTVLSTIADKIGAKEREEGIYAWGAIGLKLAPDGRHLAYYLRSNSGSLSADGVGIQLLDLKAQKQPSVISRGLGYREWLAWSPDSTKLAFIEGGGREATANKRLVILDAATGKKTDVGLDGYADSQPIWFDGLSEGVAFLRGKENLAWLGKKQEEVLMPGAKIWVYPLQGEAKVLTGGKPEDAHQMYQVSPQSKYLAYVALEGYNRGSLMLKALGQDKEVEILQGLSGESGYYGNYDSKWVSLYFNE
jgi:Tol biopolymer transport system component